MEGFYSIEGALVAITTEMGDSTSLYSLGSMSRLESEHIVAIPYPLLTWQTIAASDLESLLKVAHGLYIVDQTFQLFVCATAGLSDDLTEEVLELIEANLQSEVPGSYFLNRILIAPFQDPQRVQTLSQRAYSIGLVALGHILDQACDLQPQLNRF